MDGRSPNSPVPSAHHSTRHPQAGPLLLLLLLLRRQ
jgi:hypothetical protein